MRGRAAHVTSVVAALAVALSACKQEEERGAPQVTPAGPAVVSPEVAAAYKPGPNPLAALYQSSKARGGQAGFDAVRHFEPQAPMPKAWRQAFKRLGEGEVQAKLSAWSWSERSRLDQSKTDYELRWALELFGDRASLKSRLSRALAPLREYRSLIPKELGDQLEHRGESGAYLLTVAAETIWREGSRVHMRLELEWRRRAPAPQGERRNCRYLKGLPPPALGEHPAWMGSIFKTNRKRRFAEWSAQRGDADAPRWTGLWVYRNGSLRDKGVRWWSDKLKAHSGARLEMSGMEQRWRLPGGQELHWWSETDPAELGCLLEAPLMAVSWYEPRRAP